MAGHRSKRLPGQDLDISNQSSRGRQIRLTTDCEPFSRNQES